MPFSRYQIRNEFSLADPELYKAADKDDPEALLEGVAMAGLVGVLRQLGDLAEFAAEIFHGLHEEVMATAARGHGLLTRVQQVESDLPIIERAFLSQTGHSAFFSSSGISWHPNLQTEQNLITKGDLPRFVMDSYEECRGPPRLFLLDKFDVAGAGACLKRYTDPSFYKVEVSSYEMMNVEAQRDKKIRKTKKKGSQWKNGDTPEVLQPSHVKLHQLLLEERVQNGASEPERRVKIKKREIKFPFDTETGKGYMEKLLNSPPEDKLVHEVKMVNSPLHLPTKSSKEPEVQKLEDKEVNSPLHLPIKSSEEPEVQKLEDKMVNSPLDDIKEKRISVVEEHKEDGIEDVYESDDVASETDNYMDALATMESEVETDVEFKAANSDSITKQETFDDSNLVKIQESQVLDSQSASDDESSPMKGKVTNFSYSDSDSNSTAKSPNHMSPHVNSPHAYASTEIPFRPRVLSTQVSDNAGMIVNQETDFIESKSKESDLSEMSSSNCVDVSIPTKKEEIEIDPEDIMASVTDEDDNSGSTLVNSHVERQSFDPSFDQFDNSDPAEARVSYSNEDETELKDKETLSVDSESHANVSVGDPDDDKDGDNNNHLVSEDEKELNERKSESFISETKDSVTVSVTDESVEKESLEESVEKESVEESVEKESVEELVTPPELDSIPSNYYDHAHSQFIDSIHSNGNEDDINKPSTELVESDEKKESSKESDASLELNSIPSAFNNHSNNQTLDNICDKDGNDVDNLEKESLVSGEKKESSVESVISPESDSIPSAYHDQLNIQFLYSTHNDEDENAVDNLEKESVESGEKKESSEESDSILSAYNDKPNIHFLDSIHKNGNETDGDNPDKESIESGEKKESSAEPVISQESDSVPSAYYDHDSIHNNRIESDNDDDNPSTQSIESDEKKESSEESVIVSESDFIPSALLDHPVLQHETVFVTGKTDQNRFQDVSPDAHFQEPDLAESAEAQQSESSSVDQNGQINKLLEPSVVEILLPKLAPINMEEMPPLPPLPPMQWRMGRSQNPSIPRGGQADISNFPPVFPQIQTYPSSNLNEISRNEKFVEEVAPQPPIIKDESQKESFKEESQKDSVSEPEIIRLPSTSSLPLGDDDMPNGIRPMKVQRPRTPLIDAVAAHDKNKLRKVSERAVPLFPKEEEKDTFLEQIRAKSFNLKPAAPVRPIIQGPTTNLRVAAILEKANAIRQAFAGSDDDEDGSDSWSE